MTLLQRAEISLSSGAQFASRPAKIKYEVRDIARLLVVAAFASTP